MPKSINEIDALEFLRDNKTRDNKVQIQTAVKALSIHSVQHLPPGDARKPYLMYDIDTQNTMLSDYKRLEKELADAIKVKDITYLTNKDLNKEVEELKLDNKRLFQWKKEQLLVWQPIDDYVRPLTALGESVSVKALEILKTHQTFVEESRQLANSVSNLVEAAKQMTDLSAGDTYEELREGLEKLTVALVPFK